MIEELGRLERYRISIGTAMVSESALLRHHSPYLPHVRRIQVMVGVLQC